MQNKGIYSKQDSCSLLLEILTSILREQKCTSEQIEFIYEAITYAIYSPNTESDLFPTLQRLLQLLLETYKGTFLHTLQFIYVLEELDLSNKIFELVKEKLQALDMEEYMATLTIINAIFENSLLVEESAKEWFLEISEILVSSANSLLADIDNDISELQNDTNSNQKIESITDR